jgi:hypothetical protein
VGGGARFSAEFVPEEGGVPVLLFERVLGPGRVPADAGPQGLDVELPRGGKGKVVLKAFPRPGSPEGAPACCYWTGIELQQPRRSGPS